MVRSYPPLLGKTRIRALINAIYDTAGAVLAAMVRAYQPAIARKLASGRDFAVEVKPEVNDQRFKPD
jgi:hypothetical protein